MKGGESRDPLTDAITLPGNVVIPVLHEDRSVLAIDKPAGWMLAPDDWDRTARNLPRALAASIHAGDFWARRRQIRFLKHIHRLDAETTGVLLLVKSAGAVGAYSALFEKREMEKVYWAVARGKPTRADWVCDAAIGPAGRGKMQVQRKGGKSCETRFRVLAVQGGKVLLEARPLTGRTHQIRVHLESAGLPVLGDALYGGGRSGSREYPLGLRAVSLAYRDPFQGQPVSIRARGDLFLAAFGWDAAALAPALESVASPPGPA